MDVVFKLTIQDTPIADAPVLVNNEARMTDARGEVVAPLESSTLYTISTGLAAISFPPLLETGGSFAARSPVTIEAQRLVTADEPCRMVVDGVPHVYISSLNETSQALEVPLSYRSLNQILSVTGGAVPPELFPPGSSGRAVPLSHFTSGGSIIGQWNFLGQEVRFTPSLTFCAAKGVPGQCELIDRVTFRLPFDYTRRTILRLTNQSLLAARSGRWRSQDGSFRVPFMSRGARALAAMEGVFVHETGTNFACQMTPMSCVRRRVPKAALVKAFATIFQGKIPRGLEHISGRSKKEIAAFERELRKVPNSYVVCDE